MIDGFDLGAVLWTASVWVLPVLFAITLHEAAHGYVAWRLGDDTAYRLGRVTFNPLKHIDRFGTVVLPALLLLIRSPIVFGFAKPVPVNFARLRQPKRDMIWVALAGPGVNIGLALFSTWLLRFVYLLPGPLAQWTALTLVASLLINVILAVFNMLPLPPLDGGRVAVGLLPRWLALPLARLERWGLFIIIGVLFLPHLVGKIFGIDLHIFFWLVWVPSTFVIRGITSIAGVDHELIGQSLALLLGLG
ncbi:MAG: site-2 protease family protein [Alphaproteobacteria bacterium]